MDRNALFQELYKLVQKAYPQECNSTNQKKAKTLWDEIKSKSDFSAAFEAAKEDLKCRANRSKAAMTGFFLKACKQTKKLGNQAENLAEPSSSSTGTSEEPSTSMSLVESTDVPEVEIVQPPSKYFIIKTTLLEFEIQFVVKYSDTFYCS